MYRIEIRALFVWDDAVGSLCARTDNYAIGCNSGRVFVVKYRNIQYSCMCGGFYETHTFVAMFSFPMSTLVFDQSRLDACRRRYNRVSFSDPLKKNN